MSNSSQVNKTTMNQVIRRSDVSEMLKSYSAFDGIEALSNGHVPTLDAKIKWCGILESANNFCSSPKVLLDAGCGPSNLSLAMRNQFETIEKIYCIDVEPISKLLRNSNVCVCVQSDFFDACSTHVPDNSVDLIIDACSVTHFDISDHNAPNEGCYRFAREAMRVLKTGGVYITCSDFSIDGKTSGEFVDIKSMIESYTKGGLELIDDSCSFNLDDAFVSFQPLNLGIVRLVFVKR